MKDNILVTGGTGKTGRRVVAGLEELGHNVRVGSRSGTPAFDWNDPNTYTAALRGMDKAYIVYYPDLAVPGAKEAITTLTETALKEGLEKVVILSGKGEAEAEACEQIVAESGLRYTVVRASWFNQNFSESFLLEPILAGHVALPMPEAAIPFVDAADIADVVIQALIDDQYDRQILEVTGPRLLTFAQVVEEVEKATGRNIQYQAISLEDYNEVMRNTGLPEDYIWLFDYLFREVLGNPENQTISHDVEKVLGRKATDFSEFAQQTAATGIWDQPIPQLI